MNTFSLVHADVLEGLRSLPDQSVNCCVTSPPYWGLRNYGIPDKIWGGDPAHEHVWGEPISVNATNHTDKRRWNHTRNGRGEQVAWLRTDVDQGSFCECGAWRGSLGLEPTPQLFVDHIVLVFQEVRRVLRPDGTLWMNLGDSYNAQPGQRKSTDAAGPKQATNECAQGTPSRSVAGLKPKDLVGVPWRCAFGLQEDGWWLRSDIIWAKPAPMPESVTDRPTRSHEYIFLLTKAERYFYDHEAIKEPSVSDHGSGNGYKRDSCLTYADADGARGSDKPWKRSGIDRSFASPRIHGNLPGRTDGGAACNKAGQDFRNKRDVWTVNTQPFPDAHFAVFPPALIEPCILAGCPADGIVLDPFCGSGTTGEVSLKHGRNFIGIDLNADYIEMSRKRLERVTPMFSGGHVTTADLIERTARQNGFNWEASV